MVAGMWIASWVLLLLGPGFWFQVVPLTVPDSLSFKLEFNAQ